MTRKIWLGLMMGALLATTGVAMARKGGGGISRGNGVPEFSTTAAGGAAAVIVGGMLLLARRRNRQP